MVMQSRSRIIVVGGNLAGMNAARALDARRWQVSLLDPHPDFEWYPQLHELISRYKKSSHVRHSRPELLQRLGHHYLPQAVTAIDRREQRILTERGQWLAYDHLIIAVGNQSNIRLVPGARQHALPFGSVAEAEKVSSQLQRLDTLNLPYRPVVLVGANIEGLEVLGEIIRRYRKQWRFQLHVIDAQPQLLAQYPGVDDYLKGLTADLNIQWHQGRKVTTVDRDSVTLDNGLKLPSRLTIWCGGYMPNQLPSEAGLAPIRGYAPVDASLRSQLDARIWVAGDAAALPTPLPKQGFHALAMGSLIARNLHRLQAGKTLLEYQAKPIPRLVSFGDTGLMLFDRHALASPGVVALKEGVYQSGYNLMKPPRQREEWLLLRDSLSGSATALLQLARQHWQNRTLLSIRHFHSAV